MNFHRPISKREDLSNSESAATPIDQSAVGIPDATDDLLATANPPDQSASTSIRLLQERLKVDRKRRKVGEVIVRKVVETRLVQVPVRREKLIVEQVSPQHQSLAEIDLGEGYVRGLEISADEFAPFAERSPEAIAAGHLLTIQSAVWLLHTLAQQANQVCQQINVTLSLRVGAQTETVYCEFATAVIAERSLAAMAPALFEQCSNVYLELLLAEASLQPQMQDWFNRYQATQSPS
ncbi:YsnF/AvaK domain-containing protein [Almyronema epifaneia]|uniref:YsnF/AvaK domain-containing protein n=1 Tax=Almyronema epifaneia S1 TaxID=2991925 RepID=A0ABW6IFM1_9CYAN